LSTWRDSSRAEGLDCKGTLHESATTANLGLAVMNVGTLLNVIWSATFGGGVGWASLAPSIVTLTITDAAILLAVRWSRDIM
jgi:hypothetical protein